MKKHSLRTLVRSLRGKSIVVSAALGSSALQLAAETTNIYSFTFPPIVDPGATTYLNSGATLLDPTLPNTSSFNRHAWSGTADVPNANQARIDLGIPLSSPLVSVKFSFKSQIINWIAVENENLVAQTFNFQFGSTNFLIRDFNGNLGSPAPNPGGALISQLVSQSGLIAVNLAADDMPGVGDIPGLANDFPLNNPGPEPFQGLDAYVAASTAGYNGTNALINPFNRMASSTTVLTSGSEFMLWDTDPAGTQSLSFVATGNVTFSSIGNYVFGSRAFSDGSLQVEFVFVPEASFWAATPAAFLGLAVWARLRRQSR